MKSCITLAGIGVILLVLLGCMGGGWGGGFSMPPTPVETTTAKVQAVEDRFETIGTIDADEAVTVVAEMGGTIVRIPFAEGGAVGKGELLAQIDDREFKAALDRAIALRDQAQTSFDRVKTIVEQNAGSQQAFDDAQAALRVAEANVAFAKAQHDKTRITAPFAGTVGARQVSPGEFVQPGTAIAELARLEQLRVSFSVPERYLADLYANAPVRVTTSAYPDMEIVGTVMVVEPHVDTQTRNVGIVARIDNAEGKLRPGQSANIAVTLRERPSAMTIASEAIFLDQNQPFVYLVKPDSSVARSAVKLGSRSRDFVEVLGGIEAGQLVVRAGQQKIFDGAKVVPVSSLDSAATQQAANEGGAGQ